MRKTFVKLFVAAALAIAGAFNANAQMGGGFQMDPDGIAKMIADDMKQTVKLDDTQYKKVVELYTAQMKDMEKQFSSGQMPDMEAMQKQQEEQTKKLKAILTKDQFEAWDKHQKEMMQQFGGGGFGGF